MIEAKFLGTWQIISKLIESDEYQSLFHDFGWDSLLDYFEDTDIYDRILNKKLHTQLRSIFDWRDIEKLYKWDWILEFYKDSANVQLEDEHWNNVQYHAANIPLLISHIRKYHKLKYLYASVSIVHLRLKNPKTRESVLIFIPQDNEVEITVEEYSQEEVRKGMQNEVITTNLTGAISVLESIFFAD